MSDAFWTNLPGTLLALSTLFGGFYAFLAAKRARRVEVKTDAQTVVLDSAAKDTKEVKTQTNGHLTEMQRRMDDMINNYSALLAQAVEALSKSSPAPVVLVDRRATEEKLPPEELKP